MLSVSNIHTRYGAIKALRGISLEVSEREMVALIGVNGAGKSTTLATIAGVLHPVEGTITFNGESIVGRTPETIARKGISLVPEGREILASLTVEENLRLGAFVRNNRQEYQKDLEDNFALFPILKERFHQLGGTLSGGEQQQLAIARALMSHPKLLMLDEPSLGLAPIIVDQIFTLIRSLHERGVTILLVEQNVERTLEIVDRAYLLHTGTIQTSGDAKQMRSQVDIEGVYLGGSQRS
ncbi:MAG TPA: ABC transporter ATP-binding protein [Anaerolineales bacterium]|nr:ABC transporter ATP-binding protein [Anaerolineales bacterium]